ncbi:MAG: bifunctional riboflavin kinase/FAD synthetase [Vulcanibacillus sp.]
MIVYNIIDTNIKYKQSPNIMAIGYFDGVHLGHQKVISKALERAKENNIICSVMIFEPHPHEIIGVTNKVEKITPINSKINQLKKLGVNICYIVKFTKNFANTSPRNFIDEILIQLNVKGIVVGYDFTFGKNGSGNPETLKELSKNIYTVDIIEPYFLSNIKISSTRIRDCLISGNITDANKMLGRSYSFKGKVVHGDGRGRDIGFPTVNLELIDDYSKIKNGVYTVNVKYNGNKLLGVMNVGYRPTFSPDNVIKYEVYIIDFNEEIYGQELEVELLYYLREEKKYSNIEDLKKQINIDIVSAEEFKVDII